MASTRPLTDGTVTLVPTSGSGSVRDFALHVGDETVGTMALVSDAEGRAELLWNAPTSFVRDGQLARGLKLIVAEGLGPWGLQRIEALVDADDLAGLRATSLAGLRREGTLRGRDAGKDQIITARLAGDPDPYSPDGFVAILNAGLPTKRVIAQGIMRDESGRVLLCELTYKKEWDLPGGVIEPGESPATGLVRELAEELGIEVTIHGLITVNWLPAWKAWDDACVFVFDLGVAESDIVESMTYQPTEIRATHWCDADLAEQRATGATIELLSAIDSAAVPAYRESPQR